MQLNKSGGSAIIMFKKIHMFTTQVLTWVLIPPIFLNFHFVNHTLKPMECVVYANNYLLCLDSKLVKLLCDIHRIYQGVLFYHFSII